MCYNNAIQKHNRYEKEQIKKKVLSLILAVAMLATAATLLSACGGNPKDTTGSKDTTDGKNTTAGNSTTAIVTTAESTTAAAPTLEKDGFLALNGKTVSFQSGTTAQDKMEELNNSGTIKAILKPNEQMATAFEMLKNGEIDAVVVDSTVADGYVAKNPDKFKVAYLQKDAPEQFAIAIPKGATAIKTAINAAMAELEAEGFMSAVYDKWFGSGADVTMPTAKSENIDTTALTFVTAGTLTVGSEMGYEPFEFKAENGDYVGFDIDVATAISVKLGLNIHFVDRSFDVVFKGMGTDYDVVMAAVTIDPVRMEQMDFSTPYMDNYLAIVVAK